jgi:ankyrin repeat protein
MDARLPQNPNLGFYRKSAKELKRAIAAGDPAAAARLVKSHPRFSGAKQTSVLGAEIALGDAQLVIARELGFSNWSEFKVAVAKAASVREPSLSERLLEAIRARDANAVRKLCSSHPKLAEVPDAKGVLPLVEACHYGALEIATILLDAGADLRKGDPLLAAAHAGPHKRGPATDVVDLLIGRGAPKDVFTHAMLGRIDELRRELANVDLEARGPQNSTALFLAAWNGQIGAVRLLLEAGAEPNPICRDGQSVWQNLWLHIWSAPHREIAKLLLEHGVPCSLDEACVLSHLPTVERLLAEQPELKDRPNERGITPLMRAILNADARLARVLLDAGAEDPQGLGRALVEGRDDASGATLSA